MADCISSPRKIEEDTNDENVGSLRRHMSLLSGIAMVAGFVIGSGIFASPGEVTKMTGSVGLSIILWIVGGVLATIGALSYAELGAMFPTNGADQVYLSEAFHPMIGLGYSFTHILVVLPFVQAAMSSVFGSYLLKAIRYDTTRSLSEQPASGPWDDRIVGLCSILVIGILQMIHKDAGTRIQNVFTAFKLLALVFLILTGIVFLCKGHVETFRDPFASLNSSPADGSSSSSYPSALGCAQGIIFTMFSYSGFNNLNTAAGELKNPRRNLPLAVIGSLTTATLLYFLVNVAYFAVLPGARVAASSAVAMDVGMTALGPWAAYLIAILVAFSAFGAQNGAAFGHSRLIIAAADSTQSSSWLSPICGGLSRLQTPVVAFVLNILLTSVVLIVFQSFAVIGAVCSMTELIYYALASVSVLRLRHTRPDTPRTFRVPLVCPVFFILCCAAIYVLTVVGDISDLRRGDSNAMWKLIGYALGIVTSVVVPIILFQMRRRRRT